MQYCWITYSEILLSDYHKL